MTQLKARAKFDMSIVRARAKEQVKRRHKKTISLHTVDKIWKEYVEYAIIRPTIKYGIADIHNHFKVGIIGKEINKSKQLMSLLKTGLMFGNNIKKPALKWLGKKYIYKIKIADKNCKSKIIFEPSSDFKKRVKEKLKETGITYKIEN